MTTKFLDFNGDLLNPNNIYKMVRVTDTVTVHLLVAGTPAGSLVMEDFVFASEQDAIDALEDFVRQAAVDEFTFGEALEAVTIGSYSNSEVTKGAFNNVNLGTPEDRIDAFHFTLIVAALDLKLKYDAAV